MTKMDCLTEEEEYELHYADDLEVLNEIEGSYEMKNSGKYQQCIQETDISSNELSVRSVDLEENAVLPMYCFNEDKSVKGIKRSSSCLDDDTCLKSGPLNSGNGNKKLRNLELDSIQSTSYDTQNKETSSSFKNDVIYSVSQLSKSEQLHITGYDGSRKYLRMLRESDFQEMLYDESKKMTSLLTVPIAVLKDQVHVKVQQRFLNLQKSVPTEAKDCSVNYDEDFRSRNSEISKLWVDKYHPQSYMDLLSDEGVNRALLQWLKLWDKVVFGKESKTGWKKEQLKASSQKMQPKFKKLQMELNEEPDEHGRPHHKVAFLCGPPGLGKTTLAHIIAEHAGYSVVELNASDDRSPDIFRTNLEAATQMKSVLNKDGRPNCLIIDEIDGAPLPSINVLVSFIKSSGIPKGKRKKGDVPLLLRPVICICNDQYTSALKPLRQLAVILNFPPTATNRLASRLYEVASKEHLKADMMALTLLCEKTDNDIRSCLSTLQFIHSQKKELQLSDVNSTEIGQKDLQKSLFAVWHDIFHISRKKITKSNISFNSEKSRIFEKDDSSISARFCNILQAVQTCSEYEKLLQGMFENYLNINYKDTHLEALWKGPEWMCFSDLIQQEILHSQLYILMPYLPYVAVVFHLLYGTSSYPRICYPSSYFEYKTKRTQFLNILSSITNEVIVVIKGFINFTSLVLDLLPILLDIIKPTLRPVNTHLYSDYEKAELQHVIEVMIAFNLNYHQERSVDGQYHYMLEPNVEELVYFTGMKPRRILTYAAKQLIAREVDMEKMRRNEDTLALNSGHFEENSAVKIDNETSEAKRKILTEKPLLDFFGRKVEKASTKTQESDLEKPSKNDIWFHFKEGYSNAVRRTVWMQNLL